MNKHLNKLFGLATLLVAFGLMALITSCEGPEGPAGAAGTEICGDCHGFDAPVWGIVAQYNHSGHANGTSWERGSSGSCAACHSGEGFALLARGLEVVAPSQPSGVNCIHCHTIHNNYDNSDFAPATVAPVTLGGDMTDGATVDLGKGNLCANCHQSRERGYDWTAETMTITSSHFGPHHGTQTNTLVGNGLYEVAGSMAYNNSMHGTQVENGCVDCHMVEANHSFEPDVAACTPCHSGAEDFDINGFQTEIAGLMDQLKTKLMDAGMIEEETEEGVTSVHPVTGIEVTIDQAGAEFNYFGLLDDGSMGVHNPKYIKAILTNSIEVFD